MAREASAEGGQPGWRRYRVILYLLLGLAAVDVAVLRHRHLWHAYDPDDYGERLQGCRRQPRDLVVIGGSPVSEGIDPAVLTGLRWQGRPLERVYNLGLPGATMAEIWHAVEHGLAAPPRLLLYGISASDLNDDREEPHGPRTTMDLRDVAFWVRHRPRSAEWCVRHYAQEYLAHGWSLFYHRNAIRLWAADRVEQLWPGACPEATEEARAGLRYSTLLRQGHGYAPRPEFQVRRLDQIKAAGVRWTRFHFFENYRIPGYTVYLDRLLDWAAEQKVPLVLVDMPVSADLEALYPQAFATFRERLAAEEKARGLHVLRARRDVVGLGDADFADLVHLNAQGTARLSRWIREQLARAEGPSPDGEYEPRTAEPVQGGAE